MAWFDRVNNLTSLIEAFNVCKEQSSKARLLLVGDGEQMEEIERLVTNLNLDKYVSLSGRRMDIPRCLQVMDIYVQPSLYEGVSNTILEAMSVGLPIVATKVGGTPEIVQNGRNGILVKSDDSMELITALITLLKDTGKRIELGKSGRVCIQKHFSLDRMIATYENLFLRIAKC